MAGFDDILKEWDLSSKRRKAPDAQQAAAHQAIERWLAENPIKPKSEAERDTGHRKPRLSARNLPVEAELDLHGFRVAEAIREIDSFLERSHAAGVRKVLIVHGKGLHSVDAPVLKQAVLEYLRRHRLAGATGVPTRKDGGSGAVWVMVRR